MVFNLLFSQFRKLILLKMNLEKKVQFYDFQSIDFQNQSTDFT